MLLIFRWKALLHKSSIGDTSKGLLRTNRHWKRSVVGRCKSCNGCPTSSRLHSPLEFYDSSSSARSSLITCSDSQCSQARQSSDSGCSRSHNQCTYRLQYMDDSETSGYYVSDLMHLKTMGVDSGSSNSSAKVVFGCSTSETGDINNTWVEGIFGFGQESLSVISQLSSQGLVPDSFSHCLVGSGNGGGILVICQIMDPNMAYTPLVHSHVSSIFPTISLNIQGGSSMHLRPQDYLLQDKSKGGAEVWWCLGLFSSPDPGMTILGDLVLKDKIIVYDLGGQRLGWSDYNCSSSVNVSSTSSGSSPSLKMSCYHPIPMLILASIVQKALTFSSSSQWAKNQYFN